MIQALKSSLIWQWRQGFKATSRQFFDLPQHPENALYMPDAAFRPLASTNKRMSRAILNDKVLFEKIVGCYAPVPPTLALIEQGQVMAPARGGIDSTEALLDHLRTQPVALKPVQGQKGQGVYRLSWADGVQLDGAPLKTQDFRKLLGSLEYYMVVPWIEQAAYTASVFPEASNCLRLITMQDPDDNQRPFIVAAVQKFGTRASAPTDNWSRGALFAPVELATGEIGAGLEDLAKNTGKAVWHDVHPDTGVRIAGVRVPNWQELTETLLRLCEVLPIFTYVGWDVLLTETGFYIIEGNPAPVVVSLQLLRPALADPRVKRFVAFHKIRTPGMKFE